MAHYFSWYMMLLVINFQYWILDMKIGSLNTPPIDPLLGLLVMWIYTFFSIFFVGWITLPVGALIGGIYGYWQYRRIR